jgi:hypothetical protein
MPLAAMTASAWMVLQAAGRRVRQLRGAHV